MTAILTYEWLGELENGFTILKKKSLTLSLVN